MVARLRLMVAWSEEDGGGIADLECVLPPCIVAAPTAACIYAGLFHNTLTKHIMAAREMLFNSSAHVIGLSEFDCAGANFRLEAHLLQKRQREFRGELAAGAAANTIKVVAKDKSF